MTLCIKSLVYLQNESLFNFRPYHCQKGKTSASYDKIEKEITILFCRYERFVLLSLEITTFHIILYNLVVHYQ